MTVRMRLRRWARTQGNAAPPRGQSEAPLQEAAAGNSRPPARRKASPSASDRLRRAVCLARAAQARAAGESFGLPRYACPMARARRGLYRGVLPPSATRLPRPNDSRSPSAMPTSPCLAAAVCRTPRRSAAGQRSRIRTEQTRRMPRPSPCRIMCSTRSRRCPFPMCHRSTAR